MSTGTVKPSLGNFRFEKALHDAAPAVWVWEASTDQFLISARVREIYGFSPDQVVDFRIFCAATESSDRSWMRMFDFDAENDPPVKTLRYRIQQAGTGATRWIQARIAREPAGDSGVWSYTGILEDISERVDADNALIESEERLRFAVEAGKMAIWEVDLETGSVTNTPELNRLFGFPADAKPTFEELRSRYAPGEIERLGREGATWEEVHARFARGEVLARRTSRGEPGEDRTQVQAEVAIIVPPGITKHLLYRAQYSYSLDGRPRITGFLVDITERKLAEERLAILARELQHRVKNSLAVVHALAAQSFRAQADVESGMRSFLGRIRALSMATDMVLDAGMSNANLQGIVDRITSPYRTAGADPFEIDGPSLPVGGKLATAFSMILHELCTNALKYGALSRPGGRVRLRWVIVDETKIGLEWKESGGPEVQKPMRGGYGTKLLETLVASELDGTIEIAYDPQGLWIKITTGAIL